MGLHRKALQPMFLRNKWKILRGDTVMITKGKDAGQQGLVSKVNRDTKKPSVMVKGMNLVSCSLCSRCTCGALPSGRIQVSNHDISCLRLCSTKSI